MKSSDIQDFYGPKEENPLNEDDYWKGANYRKWARRPYWSAEECIALSFGKDPDVIDLQDVEDLMGNSPFCSRYAAVHEKVMGAQQNKALPERIPPVEFFAWARQHEIDFPNELEEAVLKNEVDIEKLEQRCEQLRQGNE